MSRWHWMIVAGVLCVSMVASAQEAGGTTVAQEPTTQQSSRPLRVRVSEAVMQTLLVKRVAPDYSAEARARHIQGKVLLQVVVGRTGSITSIRPVSGAQMLVNDATYAVKKWKFKPYVLNGEPVEVETQITVNFTLSQ